MNRIKKLVLSMAVLLGGIGFVVAVAPGTSALEVFDACNGVSDSTVCAGKDDQAEGALKKIINTLLWIIGILAVITIILGGVQYITSGGNSEAVGKAKNTILYSVIGLVVAILAYSIVNFALKNVF